MNMTYQALPFLVSRNRTLDYRTIVAPDFICRNGISSLVSRVAGGDFTEQGTAVARKVKGSKAGDFTVVFRVLAALESDLDGQGSDKRLRDQFGREIYLIEGFVFKGLKEASEIRLTNHDIDAVHRQLMEQYRQFWKDVEPPQAFPSAPFRLSVDQSGFQLKIEELPDFVVVNKIPPPPVVQPSSPYRPQSGSKTISSKKLAFTSLVAITTILLLTVWFLAKALEP